MKEVHPFGPVIFDDMRYLIVGTFPGRKFGQRNYEENMADEQAFSYGGRNQFWKIMELIYDVKLLSRQEKIQFLISLQIGMMDLYHIIERKRDSNLDQDIKVIVDNRKLFSDLFAAGKMEGIFCTGKQVSNILQKWFPDQSSVIHALPSPSPAFCTMSFSQKVEVYRQILP